MILGCEWLSPLIQRIRQYGLAASRKISPQEAQQPWHATTRSPEGHSASQRRKMQLRSKDDWQDLVEQTGYSFYDQAMAAWKGLGGVETF